MVTIFPRVHSMMIHLGGDGGDGGGGGGNNGMKEMGKRVEGERNRGKERAILAMREMTNWPPPRLSTC